MEERGELIVNVLHDYCLGHVTHDRTSWCERCSYDEGNKACWGYQPINFVKISFPSSLEKKVESESNLSNNVA